MNKCCIPSNRNSRQYSCWDVIRLCAVMMTAGCKFGDTFSTDGKNLTHFPSFSERQASLLQTRSAGLMRPYACSLISCIDVQPTTNKTQSHNTIMTAYHDTKRLSNLWGHTLLECVCVCVCYGFRVNWSCLWNLLRRKRMSLMSTSLYIVDISDICILAQTRKFGMNE